MTIDKIKEILPKPVYEHWMECTDLQKMRSALKELQWMIDNQRELNTSIVMGLHLKTNKNVTWHLGYIAKNAK